MKNKLILFEVLKMDKDKRKKKMSGELANANANEAGARNSDQFGKKRAQKKPEPRRSAARAFWQLQAIDNLFVSAFKF